MHVFYIFLLIIGGSLAAPTLHHMLAAKAAIKQHLFGGYGGRGFGGRGFGGYGNGAGFGNSQVVYVQNGQHNGYSGGHPCGGGYPCGGVGGYGGGGIPHQSNPYFGGNHYGPVGAAQAGAISSSWSHGGYGGGGAAAGAQASAASWSNGNAGYG